MEFYSANTMKLFMPHNQLKAFTLLELLVGMILSGIVLTATFTSYKIITSQYNNYRDRSKSVTELSFFTSQLEADFSNAKTVLRISENEIELTSTEHILKYRFTGKYVLRNDLTRIDSFNVAITRLECFKKAEPVTTENAEADEIHLQINIDEKNEEKIYLKTTDPKSALDNAESDLNQWQ